MIQIISVFTVNYSKLAPYSTNSQNANDTCKWANNSQLSYVWFDLARGNGTHNTVTLVPLPCGVPCRKTVTDGNNTCFQISFGNLDRVKKVSGEAINYS